MPEEQTFWTHLDELRSTILRILFATIVFAVVAFCFKEQLFRIVLSPADGIKLINTELTQQFVTHMKVSVWAGFFVSSPYVLYQLFRFVSPALYVNEKKYVFRVAGGGYILFFVGVLFNYYCVFPFTINFLGAYQVAESIDNTITLESYISAFLSMTLILGLVFELPIVCWLFGKMGFLTSSFMRKYRRHAIVIILIVAAVITPTTDIFTLLIVSVPMWLLYELSIFLVATCRKPDKK